MGPPQMDISNLMQFTGEGNFTGEAPASPDLAIEQAVNAEMSIARTYLDIVLKVQMAYYQKKSATTAIMLNRKLFGTKAPIAPAALLEEENDDAEEDDAAEVADADEENDDAPDVDQSADDEAADDADEVNQFGEDQNDFEDDATSFLETELEMQSPAKATLISHLDMFTAIKIRLYQTIFNAADLQKEFFLNRGMQLRLLSLGDALPAEYANFMYLMMFKTFLSTQKVSKSLEVVSTWTTWLEDELDAGRAMAGAAYVNRMSITSSKNELIDDKFFAFTAYSQFAYLDMSEFMMEGYLEYVQGSAAAPAGAPPAAGAAAASFLEVETSTEAKFVPTMLQFAGQSYYAQKLYRMYFLYYQYAAAQNGLQSVYASKAKGLKGVEGPKGLSLSKALYYNGFLPNLVYASDIMTVTAMWQMYYILAPMMGQQQQAAAQH